MDDKNELKESRNEVSRIVKKPVENIYGMASMIRVFCARCIDLLIIAIPIIIFTLASKKTMGINVTVDSNGKYIATNIDFHHQASYLGIELAISFVSIMIFLVFIPSFTNGNTIGKYLLGIRMKRSKGDKKVKWYMLLAREAYFLLVPWVMGLVMNIIGFAVFYSGSHSPDHFNNGAMIIGQLGYIFYFFWFIFILITTRAQDEHQSGIDMKFGLYVVYKDPIRTVTKDVVVKEKSLILKDEPGNLTKENIEELSDTEKSKFDKSISLEDLDLEVNEDILKKKKDADTKKLENKNNKDKDNKKDKKDKK